MDHSLPHEPLPSPTSAAAPRGRPVAGLAVVLAVACGPEANPQLEGLPTCEIQAPEAGSLHTEGRLIVDEHGRQAILRGINAGGRSKFAPYLPFDFQEELPSAPPFDEALATYLDRAQSWGLTTLRVPFSWNAFEPEPGSWNEEWSEQYSALLDAAAARGMWTIVDFHQDIYAEPLCGDGFPSWTLPDPGEPRHDCADWFFKYLADDEVAAAYDSFWNDDNAVQDDFRAMWAEMAGRHATRPGVIGFEIVNEPGWGSADRETWAVEVLTPFYSDLVAVIQEADPDALVFFDGTGLDAIYGQSPVERPDGDNLVFAPHYYDPTMYMGGSNLADIEPARVLAEWDGEGDRFDVPVFIGEFGGTVTMEDFEIYLGKHYDAFDELQLHGTQWEYSDAEELWNFENFSVVDTDGSVQEHIVEAMVRPYPRLLAGTEATWSYDPATETLVLDFLATPGGVTEVVVPTARYPEGVSLEGQGACVDERQGRIYLESAAGGAVHMELSPL